eukprot:m.164417 g.164417  ORF g.164417 m.164417 type:complete len:76 (-) comp16408_c0_seq2:2061-2288(-)
MDDVFLTTFSQKLLTALPSCQDAEDSCGWTALSWAVAGGSVACVEYLLAMGSRPQHKDTEGRSATHISAMTGGAV